MYTDDDLDAASGAGVLTAQAVTDFRAFVDARRTIPAADEERFRLLTGFNDIFVAIAACLILVAIGWLAESAGDEISALAVAAASWGLAEYFTRRRRMALPSILLLLTFVGGVFVAGISVLLPDGLDLDKMGFAVAGCAAATAIAAYLHWWRFKVPITVAAGCAALAMTLLAIFAGAFPDLAEAWLMPTTLVAGLGTFAIAMWWDSRDRARTTRRSDVAFWLHLAAAPLIVHPAFAMLGVLDDNTEAGRAVAAISIYVVLAVIALAIDRRALLISALAYVLYAITSLLEASGSISESFALTALVIGSALLLLSALWHQVRLRVVRLLPAAVQGWLPAA